MNIYDYKDTNFTIIDVPLRTYTLKYIKITFLNIFSLFIVFLGLQILIFIIN